MLGGDSLGQVFGHKKQELAALKMIRSYKRFERQAPREPKILERLLMEDSESSNNVAHMKNSFMFSHHSCIFVELRSLNLYEFIKRNRFQSFDSILNTTFRAKGLINLSENLDDPEPPKKAPKSFIIPVANHKEFKKLLRTKTNVMVIFVVDVKKSADVSTVVGEASSEVRGLATCITIDCVTKEGRKICKKLKVVADRYAMDMNKPENFLRGQ